MADVVIPAVLLPRLCAILIIVFERVAVGTTDQAKEATEIFSLIQVSKDSFIPFKAIFWLPRQILLLKYSQNLNK